MRYIDETDPRFARFQRAIEFAKYDPRVRDLACELASVGASDDDDDLMNASEGERRIEQTARLLAGVQEGVKYTLPPAEFRPPWECWSAGYGDCKSSATLLASLALAIGCEARLIAMGFRGDASHVSVQLRPFDGSPWLWAEPTMLGAQLGEHPSAALARLGPARREDLVGHARTSARIARIGEVSSNVHAAARDVMIQAFQQELGRKPSVFARQVVQAICYGETSYGRGWNPPCQNSKNWGGVQAKDGQPSCAYSDSFPDKTRYEQGFRVYSSDVEGAADVVRLLYRNMADVGRALDAGAGTDKVSELMFYDHYYGATCPNALAKYGSAAKESYAFPGFGKRATSAGGKACEAECIGQHQDALSKNATLIAKALGEPEPKRRGGVLTFLSPLVLVLGGGVMAGAGYYFARRDGATRELPFTADMVEP